MRALLVLIAIIIIYYSLKTIILSAFKTYNEESNRGRLQGEDMVLDPECRTYVIKDRAVARRIQGTVHSFCSDECADRYERKTHRS